MKDRKLCTQGLKAMLAAAEEVRLASSLLQIRSAAPDPFRQRGVCVDLLRLSQQILSGILLQHLPGSRQGLDKGSICATYALAKRVTYNSRKAEADQLEARLQQDLTWSNLIRQQCVSESMC